MIASDFDLSVAALIWVAILAIVVWSWDWLTNHGIPTLVRILRRINGPWS